MKTRLQFGSYIAALLTLLLLLTSLVAAQDNLNKPVQPNSTRSPLKPCKIDGVEEELLCGKLTVFENRKSRSGRTIDLNIVVLPALDSRSKDDPLFDLAGGPGLAATGAASFYAEEGKEYRRHRDVVLVDQRGTGASNPLHCHPVQGNFLSLSTVQRKETSHPFSEWLFLVTDQILPPWLMVCTLAPPVMRILGGLTPAVQQG